MITRDAILKSFLALQERIGISGAEQEVIRYCRDRLAPLADKLSVSAAGNLIATFRGARAGYAVMLCAHADEVGYIVRQITPEGFLLFERVGGPSVKSMGGLRLTLAGSKGPLVGVIGLTPAHIETAEEARRVSLPRECYIDIGASSREEAEAMGAFIGCAAVPDSPAVPLNGPDLLLGRAMDDRMGCALLLELAEELRDRDFAGVLHLVISVQEEIGVVGAKQVTDELRPDYCLVLDTFPAGGTPDVPENRLPAVIGGGPVISLLDALRAPMTCAYIPNPRLVAAARTVAARSGIPLQITTMAEDGYGTDAIGITNEGSHAPCLSLGIPRRYSHAPGEVVHLGDIEHMAALLLGLVAYNEELDLAFI